MKYVEVLANSGSSDTVSAIAEKYKARDFRVSVVGDDGMQSMRLLVADDKIQATLDTLQNILGAQPKARIMVLAIETVLPRSPDEERSEEHSATAEREALSNSVEKNARLNLNYIVLVVLSTIVAAIGLVEDNVAVIVGAMVIAPLLGPNLALSVGTALGNTDLILNSARTLIVGIVLAVLLGVVIGALWPSDLTSPELMARTEVGLDAVALALASGAAAALSLTTGLSSVLVGVMVAVALLPPAATLGLMIGHGHIDLAAGAGLLLAINIVCVNLASKVVFIIKGIRPRTKLEKERATRATIIYLLLWLTTLSILVFLVYGRQLIPI